MRIYLKSMKLHLKALLEYKASFVLGLFSQVFVFLSYYFIILSFFNNLINKAVFHSLFSRHKVITLGITLNFL